MVFLIIYLISVLKFLYKVYDLFSKTFFAESFWGLRYMVFNRIIFWFKCFFIKYKGFLKFFYNVVLEKEFVGYNN